MLQEVALIILAITAAASAYILIGYPLLLALVPWRRAPAIKKDDQYEPSVSVIVAVFNGEQFIRAKLESLLQLDYPKDRLELIVVCDGSTDRTADIVSEFHSHAVRLVKQGRSGKAAAINLGMKTASNEILFFTDVRQPLEPSSLRRLAANFFDPTVGAVSGELRMLAAGTGQQADLDLYWRYELWARGKHSQIDSIFNATGCIYAIRRSLVSSIREDTLTDDAVLPLQAFFLGFRVIHEPAAIAYDYQTAAGGEFRRRMRTLAGLWQVHARTPQLFGHGNRMRIHFLSHKFGRLTLPWMVLATVAATVSLPESSFKSSLVLSEAMFLVLAGADAIIPMRFPLKRVASAARTFLIMNLCAAMAVAALWGDARRFWRQPTKVQRS